MSDNFSGADFKYLPRNEPFLANNTKNTLKNWASFVKFENFCDQPGSIKF